MKTPVEYAKKLKEKIITEKMLDDALWSVNKRAKNWRDKKREYRAYRYDKYDNAGKAERNEQEMYTKKEKLLKPLKPICIHREDAGFERVRVYDYQKNYKAKLIEHAFAGDIVWWNSYVDRDRYDYEYCGYYDAPRTYFFDYEDKDSPKYRYYLFYKTQWHSYHTPVNAGDVEKLMAEYGIPMVKIGEIETYGNDISDLLSVQFVDKLIALVESGDYTLEDVKEYACPEEDERAENIPRGYPLDEWEPAILSYVMEGSVFRNALLSRFPVSDTSLTVEEKNEIERDARVMVRGAINKFLALPGKRQAKKKRPKYGWMSYKRKLPDKRYFEGTEVRCIRERADGAPVTETDVANGILDANPEYWKKVAENIAKSAEKRKYLEENREKWAAEEEMAVAHRSWAGRDN